MKGAIVGGCLAALAFATLAAPSAEAAKKKPDLVVSQVSADATAELGEVIAITDTTKNRGKKAAKASGTTLFLSTDATFDGLDIELSPSREVAKLKPKKSSTDETSADISPSTPTGSYRVIACADFGEVVNEKSESNNCAASAGTTAIQDTTDPAAPVFTGTTPPSPANNNAPVLNGTAEDGSTVTLYGGPSCGGTAIDTTTSDGDFDFGPDDIGDDETHGYTATATDGAGNDSACSAMLTYVEDSTAPDAPIGLHTFPGQPADDPTPFVRGAAESGTTVDVYATATCTAGVVGSGAAAGNSFDILVAPVAYNSTTQYTAKATDPAGNVSGCSDPVEYMNVLATEVEPNETPFQATQIPDSGTISGVLSNQFDIDVFKFTIPPGSPRSVRLETFNINGTPCLLGVDTVIDLLESAGAVMIQNDDKAASDVDRCSKIDGITQSNLASNLMPGTYYARVTPYDAGSIGSYRLELEISP